MSCDRFIYFKMGKVPPREDVGKVLEDYLGALLTNNKWQPDRPPHKSGRWMAQLTGSKSWPFRRVEPAAQCPWEPNTTDRWIEVYIDTNNIDVITRSQDELVNNVADGFAKLVARYWQGKLDSDE